MEIIRKTESKTIEFGRLKEGDVFTYRINERVFVGLKIEPFYDVDGELICNAVDLKTNEADLFNDSDLVTIIKAALVIE